MNFDYFLQLSVNGVVNGAVYALLGVGFGLIFGVTGRFHLAYGTTLVLAVYAASSLNDLGVPLYVAIVAGIVGGSATGVVFERFLYRPLGDRPGSLMAVFVTALGLMTVTEALLRIASGSNPRSLDPGFTVHRVSLGRGIGFTTLDVAIVGVAIACIGVLWLYLRSSERGRAMRATRTNPELCRCVGINPDAVYLWVFAVGSAVVSVVGIMTSMRASVGPSAGLQPTFIALAVAFTAGPLSGVVRLAASGLVIGLVESVSHLWISSQWNQAVVFGLLALYLVVAQAASAWGSLRLGARRHAAAEA